MNPNCARCGKIVYPTEKVNCLDKFWHKACFHCETCKMTLNMKNYKGYEKKPYCNAHYPKQSFTMVADTPENLRLKQQSELQSQVRYKEEFEKNKGKGFSVVADTPELQRIKKTQDQISNSTSSPSSSRPPQPTVATRSLQPQSPYSAAPQAGAGSGTVRCTTTAPPTRTRSPSRMGTPSSTCSRSTTAGCMGPWSAPATRGCCRPTTWRPSEPRSALPTQSSVHSMTSHPSRDVTHPPFSVSVS
ncbi:LIM and SH3 domain protein 1 isoform X2 [Ictidomys tridecemlineatus]